MGEIKNGVKEAAKKIAHVALSILSKLSFILLPVILIGIIIVALFSGAGDVKQEQAKYSGTNFTGGTLPGESNAEKIWWAMLDAGFSPKQTAAAMGHMSGESGLRTDTGGGNSGYDNGRGLAGWLDVYSGQDLVAYADSKGKPWEDPDTQITFLISWLTWEGDAAEYAKRHNSSLGGIGRTYRGITYPVNAWRDYQETNDLDADLTYLTWAFYANYGGGQDYEWDGNTGDNRRLVNAKKYYEEFHNKERPKGGDERSSSTAGIRGYYTSSSGKTYTEYWQNIEGSAWYWKAGCFHCALATIMSGFGSSKTPNQLSGWLGSGYQSDAAQVGCAYPGINAGGVKNALENGGAVMMEIPQGSILTTDNGSHKFSLSQHWVALLDIKSENGKDKVYIHDPWQGEPCYGWADIGNATGIGSQFIHIYKNK